MSEAIPFHINKYFSFLWEDLRFSKPLVDHDGSYYEVKFHGPEVDIRLENYRRDLYLYVSKSSKPDQEANFFALVEFLDRNTNKSVKPNYFRNVKDLDECYRMQIEWLAKVLRGYLPEIRDFFSDDLYSFNMSALRDYRVRKHPDLYAKG